MFVYIDYTVNDRSLLEGKCDGEVYSPNHDRQLVSHPTIPVEIVIVRNCPYCPARSVASPRDLLPKNAIHTLRAIVLPVS